MSGGLTDAGSIPAASTIFPSSSVHICPITVLITGLFEAVGVLGVSNILGDAQRSFMPNHKDTKMLMRYTHLRAENLVGRLG